MRIVAVRSMEALGYTEWGLRTVPEYAQVSIAARTIARLNATLQFLRERWRRAPSIGTGDEARVMEKRELVEALARSASNAAGAAAVTRGGAARARRCMLGSLWTLVCFAANTGYASQTTTADPPRFSEQRIISTNAPGVQSIDVADLDGDGHLDVLAAPRGVGLEYPYFKSSKVVWYRNVGAGEFSDERVIETNPFGMESVRAADLDGDGDMDILFGAGGRIAWYRNDGRGFFSPERELAVAPKDFPEVYAADLDGDGDQDVIFASELVDRVAWYPNEGSGRFSAQRVITTGERFLGSVHPADLDGDGDLDIVHGSVDKIMWYSNDGRGGFAGEHVVTTDIHRASSVHAADLDGDGDLDVLSASESKVAWYRNDGRGGFAAQRIVTAQVRSASSVHAADLDGDGDLDVLSASSSDGKVAWYVNDGRGAFSSQRVIKTAARWASAVTAADLDGDGDLDVLSAEGYDGKVAWYENVLPPEPRATYRDFQVIAHRLHAHQDHDAECKGQLGANTRLADWNDIVAYHRGGGSLRDFVAGLRMSVDGRDKQQGEIAARFRVSRDGEAVSVRRHYFLTRHDGNLPKNFSAHAQIGDHTLTLGTEHGAGGYALCYGKRESEGGETKARPPTRAPAGVRATRVVGGLGVRWSLLPGSASGGAPIARYVATGRPHTGGGQPVTCQTDADGAHCVLSAAADVTYRVTVHAENSAGAGPRSRAVVARAQDVGSEAFTDLDSAAIPWRLGDFNGDGRDDMVLRHDDGRWSVQSFDGSLGGAIPVTRNLEWRLVGIGDLNGDGKDDLFLRHTQGRWAYYPMDGDRVIEAGRGWAPLTRDTRWTFAGMGDLDGDGRDDVLLRHVDGQWLYQPMSGRNPLRSGRGWAGLNRSLGWQLAGMGDFNGDGRDGVLLRHANGRWHYYAMQGRRVVTGQSGPVELPSDLAWSLGGVGDFNGDGKDDILLRHVGGAWRLYAMEGRTARRALPTGLEKDQSWQVAGVGDIDGDGTDDVLLRDEYGRWRARGMRGGRATPVRQGVANLPVDAAWSLPERVARYTQRATLSGPLTGADVTVIALSEPSVIVHRTLTDGRGRFGVPATALRDPDSLYLVLVAGGHDDAGASPGTLGAVVTRSGLLRGVGVGVLSDIARRYAGVKLGSLSVPDTLLRLSDIARVLIRRDVTGDRAVDYRDLVVPSPGTSDWLSFDIGILADGSLFDDGLSVLEAYRAFPDGEHDQRLMGKLEAVFGAHLSPDEADDSRARSVTVTLAPFGAGTVTSGDGRFRYDRSASPSSGPLSRVYAKGGEELVFEAQPDYGSRVLGWRGCDRTAEDLSSCSVALERNRSVEVSFGYEKTEVVHNFVDLTGVENSTINGAGELTVVVASAGEPLADTIRGLGPGDYIVAAASGPRKVESVQELDPRRFRLQTSFAALEDIVQEGTIYLTKTVTEGDLSMAATPAAFGGGGRGAAGGRAAAGVLPAIIHQPDEVGVAPGARLVAPGFYSRRSGVSLVRSGDPAASRFVIELGAGAGKDDDQLFTCKGAVVARADVSLEDLQAGCTVEVRDSEGNFARLRGVLEVDLDIEFAASWSVFRGLEYIKSVPTVNLREEVEVSVGKAWHADERVRLATFWLTPITFALGPVPVWLQPVIDIYVGVQGKIEASISTGVVLNQSIRAGFVYRKGEGTQGIGDFDASWEPIGATAGVKGSLKPYIRLASSVFIYGAAGPSVSVDGYLQLGAQAVVEPSLLGGCTAAQTGVTGRVGLESHLSLNVLDEVGYVLGDLIIEKVEVSVSLFNKNWPLFDVGKKARCGPYLSISGPTAVVTKNVGVTDPVSWTFEITNEGNAELPWRLEFGRENNGLSLEADRLRGSLGPCTEVGGKGQCESTQVQVTANFVASLAAGDYHANVRFINAHYEGESSTERPKDAVTGTTDRAVTLSLRPASLPGPRNFIASVRQSGTRDTTVLLTWDHEACGEETWTEGFQIWRTDSLSTNWESIAYQPATPFWLYSCDVEFQAFSERLPWKAGSSYHLRIHAVGAGISSEGYATTTAYVPPPNRVPMFDASIDERSFERGRAIAVLRLPGASGGDGDLTYALSPVPDGLRFDGPKRELSGTPTGAAGTRYRLTYTVTDVDGDQDTLTFAVVVAGGDRNTAPELPDVPDRSFPVDEELSPAWTLPRAERGNGRLEYSLRPVPPGLRFDAARRELHGTPTRVGSYVVRYTVIDQDRDSDYRDFTIRVVGNESNAQPTFQTLIGNKSYRVGDSVDVAMPGVDGGDRPLTYGMTGSPRFPQDLQFTQSSLKLTGIVRETGTFRITYWVEDDNGDRDSRQFTLTLTEKEEPNTEPELGDNIQVGPFTVGQFVNQQLPEPVRGGNQPFRYSLVPEPTGLKLDPITRWLTGTPSEARDWEVVYRVTDSDGDFDEVRFRIVVEDDDVDEEGWIVGAWDFTGYDSARCAAEGREDKGTVDISYLAGGFYRLDISVEKYLACSAAPTPARQITCIPARLPPPDRFRSAQDFADMMGGCGVASLYLNFEHDSSVGEFSSSRINYSNPGGATGNLVKDGSADATLKELALSRVRTATFDPEVSGYRADVGHEVDRTTVTATPNDEATVVVVFDAQGATAGAVRTSRLTEGANEIGVTVEAQNGSATREYTVTVDRASEPAWGERRHDRDIDLSAADRPRGLWADGETLWAADWDGGRALAYAVADGRRLAEQDVALGPYLPSALFLDGQTLWAADFAGRVLAYRQRDGERSPSDDLDAAVMAAAGNHAPSGLYSDGETMWVADRADGHVYAYRLVDGAREPAKELPLRHAVGTAHMTPGGLYSNGETVLASDWLAGTVRGYGLVDGGRQERRDIPREGSVNVNAAGLWSDGETLYVVDEVDRKAYAYAAPGLPNLGAREHLLGDLSSQATTVPFGPAAGPGVSIPDPALRAQIAEALGKAEDEPFGAHELAALVVLDARGKGIADLTGLEHAINLEALDIGGNPLTDLGPIRSLSGLRRLSVDGIRTDLQQIEDLGGLRAVSMRGMGPESLAGLSALRGVEVLDIGDNGIRDLAWTAVMQSLRKLRADGNPVDDVGPLLGLPVLEWVELGPEAEADVSALVASGVEVVGQ